MAIINNKKKMNEKTNKVWSIDKTYQLGIGCIFSFLNPVKKRRKSMKLRMTPECLDKLLVFVNNPLPKKLYKNYTKYIQKLNKTLNLYMFCIQRSYISKFCLIMNVQKMYIKFLHIYKKCTNCTKLV